MTSINSLARTTNPFPFLDLPVELQLSVFCKCDLSTIRSLLNHSFHFRTLFLICPTANVEEIVARLPRRLSYLLRVSWVLQQPGIYQVKPHMIMHALKSATIDNWINLIPEILGNDRLLVKYMIELAEVLEEVNEATEVYAETLAANVYAFMKPWTQPSSLELSRMERLRLATACLNVRVLHQLHMVFSIQNRSNDFIPTFVASLDPYEREISLALDYFIHHISRGSSHAATWDFVNHEHFSMECLRGKSCYMRYVLDLMDDAHFHHFFHRPCDCRSVTFRRSEGAPSWHAAPSDFGLSRIEVDDETNFANSGWFYLDSVREKHDVTSMHYSKLFLQLGILFWDERRLAALGFSDPDEFPVILQILALREQQTRSFRARVFYDDYGDSYETLKRRMFDLQIFEWTRYTTPCDFEDWVYGHFVTDWEEAKRLCAEE
ncbi:hypothetical protein BU24DRAFT_490414 [Aaosphaeria arxii CBS 175.79]|uniref:Uncharacterized protein n=1 Tax=Aaosphaeria arxii CBS 175.79 TaxID=1450172 RepID=A0A6A5XWX3_9PLEO|nr:uncharacterized protein BU24DRAFT_490414 [Aaosphaeria arxii CBS 175.79]KAF2017201.1 hypothetical protein BU24DRAFT_490414 [Aaosphaeria arxii CBS 175.79]